MPVDRAQAAIAAQESNCPVGRLTALLRAVDGCAAAVRTAVEAIARTHDLTSSQLLVAWVIRPATDGVGQTELAAQLGISPAQTSQIVEHLRQRGMLTCQRAANDRRRQRWWITPRGAQAVESALTELLAVAHRCDAALAPADQALLAERLAALASASLTSAANPQRLRLAEVAP